MDLFAQAVVAGVRTAARVVRALRSIQRTARAKTFDFAVYGKDQGTVTRDRTNQVVQIDPDGAGPAPAFEFDEPEFTVRALHGNAVLRWEYRPGSTAYFVWQQVREDEIAVANLNATRRPTDAFRVAARNVFLVKVSYWFGR